METHLESIELGFTAPKAAPTKPKTPADKGGNQKGNGAGKGNNLNGNGRSGTNTKGGGPGADKGNGSGKAKVPKGDGKCVFCGGKHFVKFCPKVPPEKKD